ncbi:IclR family transcriptional regulator C-terminal domain-containing protein [Parafrigoribacterium mesophilum]|uniref:IclR family transcriptional regulator domain-containing protein n=1 Tax=Parafrigoribacterium mesophilum TaxID=433646 RepID=UPI0031FBB0D9
MRRDSSPDFIEAIARGLDVIRGFDANRPVMSLSEVAVASGLPRPTARRILITLEQLGYVRSSDDGFTLTPRVIELGMAYIGSMSIWDVVRPSLADLVRQTNESSSVAQLDGSDVVYVARVAVPKLVTLSVTIGTRFPALSTSLGKVLLAALTPEELDRTLELPTRSGLVPRWQPDRDEIDAALNVVRERGWAITDEQLARGIRSVATAVRDGDGRTVAAVNVNSNSAETSIETLTGHHLPLLLACADAISSDWIAWHSRPLQVISE